MVNNYKFAQLQPFTLYGAGAVAGATTVTLKSFTTIAGVALAMTDFGTIGFGTIEPGNGKLEEQISFTGVTPNANGTATLTGVKTVLNLYPYTQTSGLAQTHAGSTSFVISNTAGFYDQMVAKNDDATITGLYTFDVAQFPKMSDATTMPTDQAQLATKAYADQVIAGGAPDATTSVQGKVQLATQAQTDAKTPTGSTGAALVTTPDHQRSTLLSDYVADTGTSTAYAIAPSPAISAYVTGQVFFFKATNANTTTTPTLAVNGLTAKTLVKPTAVALSVGDIPLNGFIQVIYDGTNFQIQSASNLPLPAISSSNINQVVTTTNGTSFSFGRNYDYQAFTADGTWTKPTNMSGNELVVVEAWGAGGGGGGCASSGGAGGGAGGGGGGAFVTWSFKAADLSSTVAVTIGTAGTAGSAGNNNGGAGGNTTFGSYLTAYGGGGGSGANIAGAAFGGAGGGGGNGAAGSVGTQPTGGAGGGFGGGAANTNSTSSDGGAGGGTQATAGGSSYNGGGGGGGGSGAGNQGGVGGNSIRGGAGGGGGSSVTGAKAGGTSISGGAGGSGGIGATVATAGTAPGGGGGGAGDNSTGVNRAGAAGARGECRVWTIY